MIHGIPREANSLTPVPSAARPSRTARRMLFSFMSLLRARDAKNRAFQHQSGLAVRTPSGTPPDNGMSAVWMDIGHVMSLLPFDARSSAAAPIAPPAHSIANLRKPH